MEASTEMSKESLGNRLLQLVAGLNPYRMPLIGDKQSCDSDTDAAVETPGN